MPMPTPTGLRASLSRVLPGLAVAALVAVTAQFLSEHYGAPALLLALMLGLAFGFLAEDGSRTAPGIAMAARSVLRLGVALLGARISADVLVALGPQAVGLVAAGVILTLAFALLAARCLGRGWRFALLTGGAVAICGASAAIAIAAVLPRSDRSDRDLVFTILSVTLLSTLAMIGYPMLVRALGLPEAAGGLFLGATIHDVAQVVGAGFSISETTGEIATVVKLLRVAMLAPVVLGLSLALRAMGLVATEGGRSPPLVPGFLLGFLVLAALNSLGLIPPVLAAAAAGLSRWALLVAIAAVGMKTSLRSMRDMGGAAVALVIAETLFLAAAVLAGLQLLGLPA